ncbi:hypothetical protein B4110_3845 [Parageobacillus toebii]|uniref:Uncharacterized protein n=1 Tax=Parageobacillus toebii TaxID=153151 RepID=A0A150MFL0_9BACL|nr:hypothetical protein B4110_3845 [Parageobacillus toebii]
MLALRGGRLFGTRELGAEARQWKKPRSEGGKHEAVFAWLS